MAVTDPNISGANLLSLEDKLYSGNNILMVSILEIAWSWRSSASLLKPLKTGSCCLQIYLKTLSPSVGQLIFIASKDFLSEMVKVGSVTSAVM